MHQLKFVTLCWHWLTGSNDHQYWVGGSAVVLMFLGVLYIIVEEYRRHSDHVRYRTMHYVCKKCHKPLSLRHLPVKIPADHSRGWLMRFLSQVDYLSQPQGICTWNVCEKKNVWVLPNPDVNLSAVKQWAFFKRIFRYKQLREIATVEELILQKNGPDICHEVLGTRNLLPSKRQYLEGRHSLAQFFMSKAVVSEKIFPPAPQQAPK